MSVVQRRTYSKVQQAEKIAKAPFDDNKLADIIVTSSDNVDFYLVRAILIIASPFFEDMFSLAQPVTEKSGRGLDSIQIMEDSETFDCLMRLCYPVKDPAMPELGLVERVLEGAIKYQMNEAIDLIKVALRPFIKKKPLQVYAIACRQHADEEALLAARQWKAANKFDDLSPHFHATTPGKSYVAEMDTISATAYYGLLYFIRNGAFPTPSPSVSVASTEEVKDAVPELYKASILSIADITIRSFDGVDHPVNSTILRAASAGKLLDEPRVGTSHEGEKPVISVGLHSSVLADLVSFCYPLSSTKLAKVEQIRKVAVVAHKYEMSHPSLTPLHHHPLLAPVAIGGRSLSGALSYLTTTPNSFSASPPTLPTFIHQGRSSRKAKPVAVERRLIGGGVKSPLSYGNTLSDSPIAPFHTARGCTKLGGSETPGFYSLGQVSTNLTLPSRSSPGSPAVWHGCENSWGASGNSLFQSSER